ncbi:MAG: segregation/condensation protein A [Actinomycetota bacterium]|nr:segregation/condensation protein A [Actinomycetota bacterium]
MGYEVKLGVFEGPLDLLLHLITKQRVDIYEVSLATITDEYLGAVEAMGELDLETTTGFLVIAATLLELKSARLLPAPGGDESDARLLEERDLLLARLVECATYRDAGAWIAAELAAGADWHGRAVGLEPRYLDVAPDLLAQVRLADLAAAAGRLLVPKPQAVLDMSHVAPIRVSVRDAIVEVAGLLQRNGDATFGELCRGRDDRIEVVVRFLALLELYKAGAVELEQFDRFGDIRAAWTGAGDLDDTVALADEYSVEGG